jgi:hypothetical protein
MGENEQFTRKMTAVRIFESGTAATDQVEVIFLESPQFFSLSKENPAFDRIHAALQDAVRDGRPVEVRLASIASSVIEDIAPAAAG